MAATHFWLFDSLNRFIPFVLRSLLFRGLDESDKHVTKMSAADLIDVYGGSEAGEADQPGATSNK